jgi:hypothetical protein
MHSGLEVGGHGAWGLSAGGGREFGQLLRFELKLVPGYRACFRFRVKTSRVRIFSIHARKLASGR